MGDERTCLTCVFCWRADYGYSNYTVEGTQLGCLKELNPDLENKEDPGTPGQWRYEEDAAKLAPIIDRAATCVGYRAGVPVWTDCDLEEFSYRNPTLEQAMKYTDDSEAAALLLATRRRP